jgi:ABC-type multidrug transport system fused ATPase/permease subunit
MSAQRIHREGFKRIQIHLGQEILKIENKCLDASSSGVFIQRLTADTTRIADVFTVLFIHLTNIISDIGIFGAVFIINKPAFFYLLIMVILLYIVENKRVKTRNENDKAFRKKNERVAGFIGELVRGARDIKMLNAENSFTTELTGKITELNNDRYKMGKTDRNYALVRGFMMDIFDTGMIFLLVYLIYVGNLEIATALVVHNYMSRVTPIINYVSMLLENLKDFNLSATRVFKIIHSDEFKKEEFGNEVLSKVKGNFEFKDVSFSYNGKDKVLDNISFRVNANETVAFVGKSGSGKTTIFNLLCKMYDIKDGEITIDGTNIKKLTKDTIRGNITIISQSPYIFNMSIKDNLRLVKQDVTDEEIKEACKLACLDEFINNLTDGYDTIVGEGGVNLSGGQRQRLAIARALVQKTEIILFDEATSALDNETQEKIQQAIENLQKNYTILIIAHRLSTVINSDRILFLEDGKIIAEGTHKDLLNSCEEYKNLYEKEMSE